MWCNLFFEEARNLEQNTWHLDPEDLDPEDLDPEDLDPEEARYNLSKGFFRRESAKLHRSLCLVLTLHGHGWTIREPRFHGTLMMM